MLPAVFRTATAFALVLSSVDAVCADASLNAVALVFVKGQAAKSGDISRVGTAFLVGSRGELLTSLHTVEEPAGGWALDEFGVKIVRISVELRDANSGLLTDVRPASIKAIDPATDTALLAASGRTLPGLSTCPGGVLTTGDSVQAVGAEPARAGEPARLDPRQGAASEPRASDAPFSRVAVATKPGFSGGPVFKLENGARLLAGMIKGGDPLNADSHSLIVATDVMREKVLAACDVPCRHPDHGVDHYNVSKDGALYVSDWQRGGTDPTSYCDAYAGAERRRVPDQIITVIHAANGDQRFFTGWRGHDYIVREAQYKYACQLRYQADPVYVLKLSASCPAPANPLDLPR